MPDYHVPLEDCAFLEAYCRDDLIGHRISRDRQAERRRILDRNAMAFVLGELRSRFPNSSILDANTIRTNNPGYDILMDDRMRIQVKGRCWIEMIDFSVPSLEKTEAWDSDVWIAVDFAGLIDGRHGRYAETLAMAPNGRIDAYVLPTSVLRRMAEEAFAESKRPRIRAIKPGSQYSRRHHKPELFNFRNRWDLSLVLEGEGDPLGF